MPLRPLSELRDALSIAYGAGHTRDEQTTFNAALQNTASLEEILLVALREHGMRDLRGVDLSAYVFVRRQHKLRDDLYTWAQGRDDVKLPAKRTMWSKRATIRAAVEAGFDIVPYVSRMHGHERRRRAREAAGFLTPSKEDAAEYAAASTEESDSGEKEGDEDVPVQLLVLVNVLYNDK
jgi:hypothetical protein